MSDTHCRIAKHCRPHTHKHTATKCTGCLYQINKAMKNGFVFSNRRTDTIKNIIRNNI